MAIYSLHITPASRGSGKNAVAMAAYRAGERLLDRLTGQICDYTRKAGILFKEIFCPDEIKIDRQELWNLAEQSEKRKDARVAREIRIALPHELSENERINLAKYFAKQLVDRYKIAVDLSLHQPDRQGDNRNFHAHLLLTTRQMTLDGLRDKSDLEKSDKALKQAGKLNGKEQIIEIRELWETMCNFALERHGIEERISAKSYKSRNIDLNPTIHLGQAVTAMERRGIDTELGTWNRIVRKNNLNIIIQNEINRIQKIYESLNSKILSIKNEIIHHITPNLQQEIQPKPKPKSIGQLLIEYTPKIQENIQNQERQNLSIDELLKRQQDRQQDLEKSTENTRQLSVEEMLERNQFNLESGFTRDKDGIKR